jgi:hypothetical protein
LQCLLQPNLIPSHPSAWPMLQMCKCKLHFASAFAKPTAIFIPPAYITGTLQSYVSATHPVTLVGRLSKLAITSTLWVVIV